MGVFEVFEFCNDSIARLIIAPAQILFDEVDAPALGQISDGLFPVQAGDEGLGQDLPLDVRGNVDTLDIFPSSPEGTCAQPNRDFIFRENIGQINQHSSEPIAPQNKVAFID